MLQRIQSLYLLAAALCSGILPLVLPLFNGKEPLTLLHFPVFTALFVLSTLISLFSIFRYARRKQQIAAGRFNIILNFTLFGLLVYYWYAHFNLNPQNMGLGLIIPVVVVVLVSMANRHITKDELLVRSADRLR